LGFTVRTKKKNLTLQTGSREKKKRDEAVCRKRVPKPKRVGGKKKRSSEGEQEKSQRDRGKKSQGMLPGEPKGLKKKNVECHRRKINSGRSKKKKRKTGGKGGRPCHGVSGNSTN